MKTRYATVCHFENGKIPLPPVYYRSLRAALKAVAGERSVDCYIGARYEVYAHRGGRRRLVATVLPFKADASAWEGDPDEYEIWNA